MSTTAAVGWRALLAADSALRRPRAGLDGPALGPLVLAIIILTPFYGAAMGSFGFTDPQRRAVTLYAAIKAPLLLLLTTGLCLAPFAVLAHVARLQSTLHAALQAILSGQACAAAVLAAAAPVTLVVYTGVSRHDHAVLYNTAVFGLAALLGHRATRQRFAPLIASHPRYRQLLWFWCVLYCFVGVQMGWTLRPFVGSPGIDGAFFREDSFTNAYLAVGRIVSGALAP